MMKYRYDVTQPKSYAEKVTETAFLVIALSSVWEVQPSERDS